jgi:dCMP deaminase
MCRRMIINAGITHVVIRNTPDSYSVVHVEDWVREDDSLPENLPGLSGCGQGCNCGC